MNEGVRHALAEIQALESRLAVQHGLCRLDVRLQASKQEVRVEGTVLVDRLRQPVLSIVAAALPGVSLSDALQVVQGGPWHAVETVTSLHASATGGPTVTVLHPEDGPVEVLGRAAAACLVRDRCGTTGWMSGALGPGVQPPVLPHPRTEDPQAFVDAARRFVGTSYALGGTDREVIDCSGLVQRAAWSSLRVALPRNTGDLWGLGARQGRPPDGAGHLVFVWTRGESLRHVGIVAPDAVVHASLSRRVVVCDPAERFYRGVARVEHLPFEALLALGRRCAGHPNVLAAGVRLGQAPPA
ncbi:MAG: C40 family peptidase [Nannocystales bacterium]